jgi:hypothetical protein
LGGALSSALERVDGAARKAVVAESWDDPLIDSLGKHLKCATSLSYACFKCVTTCVFQVCYKSVIRVFRGGRELG